MLMSSWYFDTTTRKKLRFNLAFQIFVLKKKHFYSVHKTRNMYTAVYNTQILVICWNIVKSPFSFYYIFFCIIIPCIQDVAYSSGHVDVSYVSVGRNPHPEFVPRELGYATWCYAILRSKMPVKPLGRPWPQGVKKHLNHFHRWCNHS